MASRAERDKKKLNEQHHRILTDLLREQCNKICADCEAKAPRWASWNIGCFICIRCAGIHRNLGVHISKVKSVNLDSWTSEQVANMVEWGNRRVNKYYEAKLPDTFVRPTSDQSAENFIRAKYVSKQYAGQLPEENKPKAANKSEKSTNPNAAVAARQKSRQSSSSSSSSAQERQSPAKQVTRVQPQNPPVKPQQQSAVADLLSLDAPVNQPQVVNTSPQLPTATQQPTPSQTSQPQQQPQQQPQLQRQDLINEAALFGADEKKSGIDKDSILSLYGKTTQTPAYGVPGGMIMNRSQVNNMNTMQGQQNPGMMQGQQNPGMMQGQQNPGMMQGQQNPRMMQGQQNPGMMAQTQGGMQQMQYGGMQQFRPMAQNMGQVNQMNQLNQVTQGMNQMSVSGGMGMPNQQAGFNSGSNFNMPQNQNRFNMMQQQQPVQQQQYQQNFMGQYQQNPNMHQTPLMQGNQRPQMYNQQFANPNQSGMYPGNQQIPHGQTLNNQLWN